MPIMLGSTIPSKVYFGGKLVLDQSIPPYVGPPSPVIITIDGTYTAGTDFPANSEVTVCIVGGGGSGMRGCGIDGAGGKAGIETSVPVTYPTGEVATATIGTGGVFDGNNGIAGLASTLTFSGGDIVSAGGAGSGHLGIGASRTTCMGTSTDGTNSGASYGGQSSGIAPGGNGASGAGGIGSGGGGVQDCGTASAGAGGAGQIVISWSAL